MNVELVVVVLVNVDLFFCFSVSLHRWFATAKSPSWFGMFLYSELTSSVTSNAPVGILPSALSLLMKCCVSLI